MVTKLQTAPRPELLLVTTAVGRVTSRVIVPRKQRQNLATSAVRKDISYVIQRLVDLILTFQQSRDCPENTTSGGGYGSSSGSECYRCGKTGHIARACPDNMSGGGSYGGGFSQKTWYECYLNHGW
ncbi:hypothetical protein GYMLUDRAFT_449083 [Collybiopsis luxurians FD-317 M1]|uniref:CCHC-type domain-containing protein n=1 Tax=Collybiopsis luxurians FD-317 M1 TaxID=944289 RepID=A0A0D0CL75_9AGAR|nr:hypothetical protein GYMLUDRAFT_449083 [Collybiopsis luxurians FD-317 M1]